VTLRIHGAKLHYFARYLQRHFEYTDRTNTNKNVTSILPNQYGETARTTFLSLGMWSLAAWELNFLKTGAADASENSELITPLQVFRPKRAVFKFRCSSRPNTRYINFTNSPFTNPFLTHKLWPTATKSKKQWHILTL